MQSTFASMKKARNLYTNSQGPRRSVRAVVNSEYEYPYSGLGGFSWTQMSRIMTIGIIPIGSQGSYKRGSTRLAPADASRRTSHGKDKGVRD